MRGDIVLSAGVRSNLLALQLTADPSRSFSTMQTAAQAYGAVAKQVVSLRELEADLLLKGA